MSIGNGQIPVCSNVIDQLFRDATRRFVTVGTSPSIVAAGWEEAARWLYYRLSTEAVKVAELEKTVAANQRQQKQDAGKIQALEVDIAAVKRQYGDAHSQRLALQRKVDEMKGTIEGLTRERDDLRPRLEKAETLDRELMATVTSQATALEIANDWLEKFAAQSECLGESARKHLRRDAIVREEAETLSDLAKEFAASRQPLPQGNEMIAGS